MADLQRVVSTACSTDSNYASSQGQNGGAGPVSEQFPAGLRVLVVDDDNSCLAITAKMLRRCHYHVTTSTQAKVALNLLRENKGCFDLVLSDVHMPDMDGYKLLEYVGLEMDLPVIMMSADGRTSAVMKGIKHGACDYLIKPIREEAIKNIWQHVVRKKWHENKEVEQSGSLDDNKQGNDDVEYASSSLNEVSEGALKSQRKRSLAKEEDDGEPESDDPNTSKKPRVVWSVELHEQFVNAVNHLGIDKAVPKRILELMNVPGLTRENVASHLQKFRLFLKKMSGVSQQNGTLSAYSGPMDSNIKLHSLGRYDIQALAASGQIPPQALAAMHAEFLGRPTGTSLVPTMDQPPVFQPSLQVSKYGQFGQPLSKCPSNISKHFPQNLVSIEDVGYGGWPSSTLGPIGPNANLGPMNPQNGSSLVENLHLTELNHSINVQPSCLVSPSLNQNCSFNGRSSIIDYNHIASVDLKSPGVLSGYLDVDLSSGDGLSRQVQNSFGAAGIYGLKSGEIIDQGQYTNIGFVGKLASIPTRFAVDEYEASISNFVHQSNGNKVKQEPNVELVDSARVGIPVSQQFPPMMS